MSKEAMKLAQDLRTLADRFSEGWHDGIKIDASDIMLLSDAAEALAEQPAQQEPYCYTYTENGEEYFAPPTAYVPDDAKPLYTSPSAQPSKTCPPCHGDCNQGRTCPARGSDA